MCFDDGLRIISNNCIILSFGIHLDSSFDAVINNKYKCQVESFDPFVASVNNVDLINKSIHEKVISINLNEKWRFHRIGITSFSKSKQKEEKIIKSLDEILDYTKLKNKVIDYFKMDIEHAEWEFLSDFDIDYACKYFKQFAIETHPICPSEALMLLRKLEKCFWLYRRDTRFYRNDIHKYGAVETEFQNHKTFSLSLEWFEDEIKLIDYMISMGELYFVNRNFLKK